MAKKNVRPNINFIRRILAFDKANIEIVPKSIKN